MKIANETKSPVIHTNIAFLLNAKTHLSPHVCLVFFFIYLICFSYMYLSKFPIK